MEASARWFVRTSKATLGPFSLQELAASIRAGAWEDEVKIATDRDNTWTPLQNRPELAAFKRPPKIAIQLVSPPPPTILWKKRKAALSAPVAMPAVTPELPKIEVAAPIAAPEKKVEPKPAQKKIAELPVPERPSLDFAASNIDIDRTLEASLLEMLRDQKLPKGKKPRAPTPIAPKTEPLPELPPVTLKKERKSPIEIKIAISGPTLIGIFLVMGVLFLLWTAQKMRDLKDSRLPDPSSPTQASQESDPISSLKAPTRPHRD